MPSPEVTRRTGPPEEIRAVPVRRPGRWTRPPWYCWSRARSCAQSSTDPRFEWHVVGRFLFDHASSKGSGDNRADRNRDGDRHRARRAARGDARVDEPVGVVGELALHLVLPRHARARAAALLVLHRGAVPEARARHPVRPRLRSPRRQHADHRVPRAGVLGPRPQRGCLHGRDRARRHDLGRRRADRGGAVARHDAACRPCAGSCCRRPCA